MPPAAPSQFISADPSGQGYVLRIIEWLPPGASCKTDLNVLTIRAKDHYGTYSMTYFPLKDKGIVEIKAVGYEPAIASYPLDNMPVGLGFSAEQQISYQVTDPDGNWFARESIAHNAIPSMRFKQPRAEVGQGFVVVPSPKMPKFEEQGQRASNFVLRPLILRDIQPDRLTFRIVGTMREVSLITNKSPIEIDGLEPTVNDESLARLAEAYKGKCWAYPASVVATSDAGNELMYDPAFKPIKIRALLRLWRSREIMITSVVNGFGGNSDAGLWSSLHPILAVLEPSGGKIVTESSFAVPPEEVGDLSKDANQDAIGERIEKYLARRNEPTQYKNFYALALDDWHLRRLISPTPAEADFKGASPKIQRALYREELVRGMTYRQVAWVRGWPMIPGDPDSIVAKNLTAWEYPSAVFTDTAIFKKGRFVDYDVYKLP